LDTKCPTFKLGTVKDDQIMAWHLIKATFGKSMTLILPPRPPQP